MALPEGIGNVDMNELESAVREEMMRQTVQELVQTVTDKCFDKCVTRPSANLTGGEQSCLAKCVDRYVDCMNVITKTLMDRQQVGRAPRDAQGCRLSGPSATHASRLVEPLERRAPPRIFAERASYAVFFRPPVPLLSPFPFAAQA